MRMVGDAVVGKSIHHCSRTLSKICSWTSAWHPCSPDQEHGGLPGITVSSQRAIRSGVKMVTMQLLSHQGKPSEVGAERWLHNAVNCAV